MIQCQDCEFFVRGPKGQLGFKCDPFSNIKEPECLMKWQLIKVDLMVRAYQATLQMYQRLAPLQEKMFRHMEQEIDDIEEADRWKYGLDEEDENEDEQEQL
ncbi:MAG: hypothetical protein JSV03_13690 [Planctomycetota bacterium]|nr:MAG: hypothetical protein JSV03_13690 [Planctomycetota bacterium]